MILVAGLRLVVGGDTQTYMSDFDRYPTIDEFTVFHFALFRYQPLWILINVLAKSIYPEFFVLQIILACIVNPVTFYIIQKETDKKFVKAISQTDFSENSLTGSEGQFYKGTLKNGQVLETESSIVILGDVYPGSAIISAKDIIVLGGLYGEAYAGGNGSTGHYVAALEMSPEKLKIGDFKYQSKEKARWGIKPKIQPKIAYIKSNKIVMDSLTKELLSDLPG